MINRKKELISIRLSINGLARKYPELPRNTTAPKAGIWLETEVLFGIKVCVGTTLEVLLEYSVDIDARSLQIFPSIGFIT